MQAKKENAVKMRILFVANCSIMFGANRSMLDLAAFLKEKGEEIFFLLPVHGPIENLLKEEGFTYEVFEYKPCVYDTKYRHKYLSILRKTYVRVESLIYNLCLLPEIMKAVRRWNPDIVHSNSSTCDIGYYIAHRLHSAHVWHIREILRIQHDLEYNFKCLFRRFLRNSEAVIYISDAVKEYSEQRRLGSRNGVMVYDGFRVDVYNNTKSEFIQDGELHVLLCSNLYKQKGYMDALEAVRILVCERKRNVKLYIAGTGCDTDIKRIQGYIRTNSLQKNVELKGFQENLRPLRQWADVELTCGIGEALGRTTVEAMLAEVLVIGCASGATNELIQEKMNGLKYILREPQSLADQIEYVISHKSECLQMIKNAKSYALNNFDNQTQAEKVWHIYEDLLKSNIKFVHK